MLFNAVELVPELTSIPNVNDDAAHLLFVRRADQAISLGQDPVDFWVPDVDLGFPEFIYYQHLPHLAVVAVSRALLGSVDIEQVFNGVRYVLLVGLPITVFWSMRRLGFNAVAAAIGAAASSLLSSGGRLGFDYDSYVWRGFGVYTQLVAMHLSFITLAALHALLDRGRGYLLALIALSGLVLSHLLYAYMMAISATVLWLAAPWRQLGIRAMRLGVVGVLAALISAYLIIPDLILAPFQSSSPNLESYKYDSFGAQQILGWLVSGQLLDADRLPVFTTLLGVGVVAALVTRARPALIALALALVWLVLYFGRPTLGGLVDLFPMHQILFFHRFIGGFHLAAILIIGFGGAWLWELVPWRHPARAAALAIVLGLAFIPVFEERAGYYGLNAQWMDQTLTAIDRDAEARTIFETLAALPPGRVYAGQRTDWSEELDFGIPFRSVRLYNLLADREIASFSPPYQGGSLNSELVFDFDPTNLGQYAAFGVTYVIAPTTRQLPSFLVPIRRTPLYTLYSAPVDPAAHYAAVADTIRVSAQSELFARIRAWVLGPLPAAGRVVRIDYPAGPPGSTGATVPGCETGGRIESSRIEQGRITVVASCPTAAALVLPVTFHPNWHVTSDGTPVEAYMVTPSVIGVTLPPGTHTIVAEYRSTPMKGPLLALAGAVLASAFGLRRWFERVDSRLARRWGGG
ncbi:MAG TPA: hypothetical protein VKR80_03630 [Candidatus Limnocylindria bacterium]|nr:hypothetical protein [Candidatus Limnocylindria bacterium]